MVQDRKNNVGKLPVRAHMDCPVKTNEFLKMKFKLFLITLSGCDVLVTII